MHSSLIDLVQKDSDNLEKSGKTHEKHPSGSEEKTAKTNSGKLWGGRFKEPPAKELEALSLSTHFDFRLAKYDIQGSIAHSKALEKAGILTEDESMKIVAAYKLIAEEIENGVLKPAAVDEDVHGFLERVLIEKVGAEVGGKIRSGRSRNDQIATLIRLYLVEEGVEIAKLISTLEKVLFNKSIAAMTAGENKEPVIMPGRTHLQHAQPVLLSHHLMAHAWRFLRDLDRLGDCLARLDSSPYGSGALAGSTLGLDQEFVANELEFATVVPNSIDATASRDLVAEFLFCLSTLSVNLSSLAEEFIIWNTKEFDFVVLSDSFSTGSSIMPQKKNPDIAELTRGKTGRILGSLNALLIVLKGLPLAYNRDLQEDKEGVFDAVDQIKLILPAFSKMVETSAFNTKRMSYLAPRGFSLATDIAEFLVKEKVPFRTAHELAGVCTQKAEEKNVELWELSLDEYQAVLKGSLSSEKIDQLLKSLNVEGSVAMRNNYSGTAPKSVVKQLQLFEKELKLAMERFGETFGD